MEILGQMLGPDGLAQMAYSEEQMRQEVERQVSQYASMSVDGMMEKLFGEDMGVISAALETLARRRMRTKTKKRKNWIWRTNRNFIGLQR